jgi:hypothetical protein
MHRRIMKTAIILASSRTSTRRLGLESASLESSLVFPMLPDSIPSYIEDERPRNFQKWQEIQAKSGLLPKLATQAREKGLSLFEYIADLAPEDGGGSRLLSLE